MSLVTDLRSSSSAPHKSSVLESLTQSMKRDFPIYEEEEEAKEVSPSMEQSLFERSTTAIEKQAAEIAVSRSEKARIMESEQ